VERLIVLTKSPMHKEIGGEITAGACVVCYCPDSRKLLRLTQAPNGAPLNGASVKMFSVMDEIVAEIIRDDPAPPQNENVQVLTDAVYRVRRSDIGIQEIEKEYIAGNSARFMDDTSPVMESVADYDHSVEIVHAHKIRFVWRQGKKRPLAYFSMGKDQCSSYRVTEPGMELREPASEEQERTIEEAYLVISIPNVPFKKDGKYYKFIASVFPTIENKTEKTGNGTPEMILQQYFGYPSFRHGQREVIEAILTGRDSLCVMPTGQGKSLCYQIPAMLLQGVTLVVSPLISLMKDQTAALIRNGIPAAYLNGTLNSVQQDKVLRNIVAGKYKVVYVAPEKLSISSFQNFCTTIRIAMIAVDEAHCVSQWGPNFRYDYLDIGKFVDKLPGRPVIGAFTATATPRVAEDIRRLLKLNDPFFFQTGFDRPNLYFGVLQPKDKKIWVRQYLDEHRGKSGIIYCSTRKTTEQLCDYLVREGYPVSCYHAGLPPEVRTRNQEDFLFDHKPVITATNAFGMGIDKPNVSFVIHYNIPKSMESYYQEAGRAGRDGSPADCILLYDPSDLVTNRRLIEMGEPSPDLTQKEAEYIRKADIQRLIRMAEYAEGTGCLRSCILKYFGEKQPDEYCGNCSNCRGEYELTDIREEGKKILSCVARTGQRFGKEFIVNILKGKKTARHTRLGMEKQTTWGIMSRYTIRDINRMITALISGEYLRYTEGQYPVLILTEKSHDILFGDHPLMIRNFVTHRSRKKNEKGVFVSAEAGNELYELLRAKRNEAAAKENVPPYVILDNKTLKEIAAKQPCTEEEFLKVRGIGKIKMERYASLFLPVVREYLKDQRNKP